MKELKTKNLQAGKDYLSNNSLSTFRSCPFKFDLTYNKKIYPIYKSISLYFGEAMHAALDYHYSGDRDPDMTIEFFRSYFEGNQNEKPIMWSSNKNFTDSETAMAYGSKMLEAYFKNYEEEDNLIEVVESEKDFSFDIEIGLKPKYFDIDGITVETPAPKTIEYTGIIDQIIKINGLYYGRDFKFMAQKMNADYLTMDNQISGYYLGAKSLGYDLSGFIYDCGYKYVKPIFERILVTRTKKKLDDFLDNTKQTIKALQSGAKYKNISRDCSMCNFNQYCLHDGNLGEMYAVQT